MLRAMAGVPRSLPLTCASGRLEGGWKLLSKVGLIALRCVAAFFFSYGGFFGVFRTCSSDVHSSWCPTTARLTGHQVS